MDNMKLQPNAAGYDQDDDAEIDLGEIFGVLTHYLWLLLIVTIAAGVAGYCIARFAIPEQYESTTKIYVLNTKDENTNTYTDLQVGASLTKDYAELIKSRTVLEGVIDKLSLPLDYDTLVDKVDVTTPSDTRIVAITVTDHDPQLAQRIANEVRTEASDHIQKVMAIDAVNVVEKANLPTEKSAPSNTKWAAIFALVALLGTAVVIVVRYVVDDSIKTRDDIEKYLGLPTLSLIPLDEGVISDDEERGRRNLRHHGEQPESGTRDTRDTRSAKTRPQPQETQQRAPQPAAEGPNRDISREQPQYATPRAAANRAGNTQDARTREQRNLEEGFTGAIEIVDFDEDGNIITHEDRKEGN